MSRIVAPSVLLFDVNETLSDVSGLEAAFAEVGLPRHLAATWFSAVLRDGFAITVTGRPASFKQVGADVLRTLAVGAGGVSVEAAVNHVLASFMTLELHPDVADGLHALKAAGIRLATLTNGASAVPESLLAHAGIPDVMERYLSVDDAGIWKPHADAYTWAVRQLGVEPGDAMLVASHPWDIDGAARAGLRTAYLDRQGGPYPRSFRAGDVTASSLVELADSFA